MTFIAPDHLSTLCFAALCGLVIFSFLWGAYKAFQRELLPAFRKCFQVALGLLVWLGLFSVAVYFGWVTPEKSFTVLIAFVSSMLIAILIGFSRLGSIMSLRLSLRALVAFQMFRLPLEIILHQWVIQGIIPETMTWTGSNMDVISGLSALIGYFFVDRYRWVAWTFNIIGSILLFNVMRVAVLSSPLPFAWQVTPPLQLLFHFPYALIVPVCVGGALAGHIILTRALLSRRFEGAGHAILVEA